MQDGPGSPRQGRAQPMKRSPSSSQRDTSSFSNKDTLTPSCIPVLCAPWQVGCKQRHANERLHGGSPPRTRPPPRPGHQVHTDTPSYLLQRTAGGLERGRWTPTCSVPAVSAGAPGTEVMPSRISSPAKPPDVGSHPKDLRRNQQNCPAGPSPAAQL